MSLMTTFRSMFSLRCPNCRKGHLFVSPVSKFKDLFDMEKECSNCTQPYFLEVGFYWGAMYMAYYH